MGRGRSGLARQESQLNPEVHEPLNPPTSDGVAGSFMVGIADHAAVVSLHRFRKHCPNA
jgi:hypothetical protein